MSMGIGGNPQFNPALYMPKGTYDPGGTGKIALAQTSGVEGKTEFDAHDHTGVAGHAPQINTAGIVPGAVTDVLIGNRTIDDTQIAAAGANTPTMLWNFLGNMVKRITGEVNWLTAPAMTLKAIFDRFVITPKQTTANLTYYVNTTTGNDSNDGLTAGTAFKTWQKAIDILPQIINHAVTINVSTGTYAEAVTIAGFTGIGSLSINGDSVVSTSRSVTSILINQCTINIVISGFNFTTTTAHAVQAYRSSCVSVTLCNVIGAGAFIGFYCSSGILMVSNSTVSNRSSGVYSESAATIFSNGLSGTGNTAGLQAVSAGTIVKFGTQPAGTSAEVVASGGLIR